MVRVLFAIPAVEDCLASSTLEAFLSASAIAVEFSSIESTNDAILES